MRSAQIFTPNHMAQLLREDQVEGGQDHDSISRRNRYRIGRTRHGNGFSVCRRRARVDLLQPAQRVWGHAGLLSPEILNLPPCDDEVHGYCVSLCVRVGKDE